MANPSPVCPPMMGRPPSGRVGQMWTVLVWPTASQAVSAPVAGGASWVGPDLVGLCLVSVPIRLKVRISSDLHVCRCASNGWDGI